MELIDVGVLCLYNTVLCRMEELILCESLGMWGYAYAGSVGCVFERVYIVICLLICSAVGNCSVWSL